MNDMPRRCGARLHKAFEVDANGKRLRGTYCRKWALPGRTRCELHGGRTTGPKTPEGLARTLAAMREGRKRYEERMKAEGRKFPWGFKKDWRRAKKKADEIAAIPVADQQALAALDAIAQMRAALEANQ